MKGIGKMIYATIIFVILLVAVALVQLALAFGAPLGELTLGGRYKGQLPMKLRFATLIQILILCLFAIMALAKAQLAFEKLYSASIVGMWFIVIFFVFGNVMNWSSRSKKERYVMGPANTIALICALIIAIG